MEAKHGYLDCLLKFERRVCRIYEKWATNEHFPEDVRALWRDMTEEEKQHLAILERSAGLLGFAAAPPPASAEKLEKIAAQIETVERASHDPEPEIDTVFAHALAVESSELNQLGDAWLKGFQPDLGNLTQAWVPACEQHIQRLAAAVRRFSTDEDLHKKAVALLSQLERQKDLPQE